VKKYIYILLIVLGFVDLNYAQKSKYKVSNIYTRYQGNGENPMTDSMTVVLEQGFKDSIYFYMNDLLITSDYYITDESLGFTGGSIKIKNNNGTLYLYNKREKNIAIIPILINYETVRVNYKGNNQYNLTYINSFITYE